MRVNIQGNIEYNMQYAMANFDIEVNAYTWNSTQYNVSANKHFYSRFALVVYIEAFEYLHFVFSLSAAVSATTLTGITMQTEVLHWRRLFWMITLLSMFLQPAAGRNNAPRLLFITMDAYYALPISFLNVLSF